MDPQFQPSDKVRHKLHQIEYIVVSAYQGQQQFFYNLKDENGKIISDVPEHELEVA